MSVYYPDPPVQNYWPDESYRYWADYHGTDYWPDLAGNGYQMDEPLNAQRQEDTRDSCIWTTPVLSSAPAAPVLSNKPTVLTQQPTASGRPLLSLVGMPASKPAVNKKTGTGQAKTGTGQANTGTGASPPSDVPSILDRKVLLIDSRQSLKMFLEAGNADGYTNAELLVYLGELEHTFDQVRTQLRGNMLQRIKRFLTNDES